MCGGDGKKVTPVPIPNTEVKLLSADCSEGFPFVRVGRCRATKRGWDKISQLTKKMIEFFRTQSSFYFLY